MSNFDFEIGTKIKGKYSEYIISDRYMKSGKYPSIAHKMRQTYLCQCLKDNNTFELLGSEIKKKKDCPICGRLKLDKNETIRKSHPELLIYLKNIEDADNYTYGSNHYIKCKCPICGFEKDIRIINFCKHGFSCNQCSDGISYPNKFIQSFLNQINIKHYPEKSFDWSEGHIYDQYIPSLNMIIENHGLQHYDLKAQFSNMNHKDVHKNDLYKKELAFKNGISYYVELDCKISNKNYIINSIQNSILVSILDFDINSIDWNKCELDACTTIKQSIWKDWNNAKSIQKLIDKYQLSDVTIRTYINQGYSIGCCDPYEIQYKGNKKSETNYNLQSCKPLYCETDDIYFATRFDCEKYYPDLFPKKTGSYNLYIFINKNKPYKNKKFIYITKEKFFKVKAESLNNPALTVIGDIV